MTKRLLNKTAIITGGTTGIGFDSARRYLEEGATVLITGRTHDKVDIAVAELGEGAYGLAADSTELSDLDALAAKASDIFDGQVDILFVNAGNGVFAPIADVDEVGYAHQFDLNVKGVFFTVQKILPLMSEGGSIILTASAVNAKGGAMGSLYFASKAAVRSFARSMAAELGPQGIRVNSLSPGIVPTKFFANSNIGQDAYGGFAEMIIATAPLARAGTSTEMADAAVYLGSDESSYMTAADHVVDGGWMNV